MIQKKPLVRRPAVSSSSMSLQIKQSEGKADIYHTSWIVMGPPGIGKSTLFSGFEDVLFLVTSEKEVKRLKVPYMVIDTWDKTKAITDELINHREKYKQYKFIAIDFVDAVWTLCEEAVCKKLGVDHHTDAKWGKGSGTIANYFKKWMTTLVSSDYGVLLVSHVAHKEIMSEGGTTTKTVSTLSQKAREVILPLINVLGCIEYSRMKVMNPATGKPEIQNKRVIRFEGTDYVEAKDRDGVLPKELVLMKDPAKNFQIFKEYYDGKRK